MNLKSAQAVRVIIADSSLFQAPVHQVSLKEDVHSLPDFSFPGVVLMCGQLSLAFQTIVWPVMAMGSAISDLSVSIFLHSRWCY
ncbi:unnamed protein product [Protopolystoma xenopodis]|uniref:Uncharacterized protein n=1 Tax=Protopolystoma xenopodis TaxID=117903 RepID=A0A448X540_9PLAT|nr:unnamed protein product [Protopolystoma xenopodis]